MKKVIVFRVENVLVKDFNREDSFKRALSVETNRIKRAVGLDVMEKELKGKKDKEGYEELKRRIMEKEKEIEKDVRVIEEDKRKWVLRREKEFYDNEFEKSKFKNGVGEIIKVLKGMERMGVELAFVSDYRRSKAGRILWGNGMRDKNVENCSGDWVGRILEGSGRDRKDVVLFSNKAGDMEMGEQWGIRVESYHVETEGMGGLLGKIGLKQCA